MHRLIAGSDLSNIAIVGRGTINGRERGGGKMHKEKNTCASSATPHLIHSLHECPR